MSMWPSPSKSYESIRVMPWYSTSCVGTPVGSGSTGIGWCAVLSKVSSITGCLLAPSGGSSREQARADVGGGVLVGPAVAVGVAVDVVDLAVVVAVVLPLVDPA